MVLGTDKRASTRALAIALVITIAPFITIPLLGSQFYFRHDDASAILWSKEFVYPLHHAFSPDPAVNHFNDYPGMAGAWRPFNFLYVKILWYLFGSNPAPYQIIGGLCFIGAVLSLFGLAAREYGIHAAVLGCLGLFASFHGTMYNLFHIAAPSSYLFQVLMVVCFWRFLQSGRLTYAIGMVLLFGPSMGRQTTAIILTAILIVFTLERLKLRSPLWGRTVFAGFVIGIQVYMGTLNPNIGYGSIVSILPDTGKAFAFVLERYRYYGSLLTTGLTGIIVLTVFTAGVFRDITVRVQRSRRLAWIDWVWPPAALIAALVLVRAHPHAIFWLTLCLAYLFIVESDLRMPLAWAGASLAAYFAVLYYHDGYLLEAAFPLSLALGITATRAGGKIANTLERAHVRPRRAAAVVACILAIGAAAVLLAGDRIPFIRERTELITISIDSNKNFAHLMRFLSDELPDNAVVFELDEEQLGTTSLERRFLPLHERASVIKVMNIRDQLVMLRVLEREDIRIHPSTQIGESGLPPAGYFIALNEFEREIAESRFNLQLLHEFRGSTDSAAIYSLSAGGD